MTDPNLPAVVDAATLPKPKQGRGTTKAQRDARRAQAVSLALSGLDYQRIADQLGYASANSCYNAVREALRSVVVNNVEELRAKHSAQLDRLLLATWQGAIQSDPDMLREARKLLDSKARLLGLNAPLQVEDVTGVDQEIAALRIALSADLGPDGAYAVTSAMAS